MNFYLKGKTFSEILKVVEQEEEKITFPFPQFSKESKAIVELVSLLFGFLILRIKPYI